MSDSADTTPGAERSAAIPPRVPHGDDTPRVGPDTVDHHDPHVEFDDVASMIRPYAWTRGRTRPSVALELETLVSTSASDGMQARLSQLEHRSVAELCRHPHSVAEVAAKLSVPLGVARVLLSDMAELGYIKVHQNVADGDMAANLVLMERV